MHFISFDGGIREIGASGKHFCFDNELPRHRTLTEPYALADRLATNGEYLEFIRDGGYRRPEFWLSDGWSTVQREGWTRPLYWAESLDREFTLHGLQRAEHRRARLSHQLLRSRRVRALGRRTPAERSRMGNRRGIAARDRQSAEHRRACSRRPPPACSRD